MSNLPQYVCPDCDDSTRRDFLKRTTAGIVSVSVAAPMLPSVAARAADPSATRPVSETLVAHLYKSLTEKQKKLMVFPFDDPLRLKVDNNWHITKAVIGTASIGIKPSVPTNCSRRSMANNESSHCAVTRGPKPVRTP